MKMGKEMLRSTVISIMMSATIFVIIGMVFDVIGKGSFSMEDYGFTKMVLACVATGIGFGVPSVLYHVEKLPMPLAAVLHLGIGLTIYFFAAFQVGWIPVAAGKVACICSVAGMVALTVIIWLGFMKYYKDLAEKMNQALREKNRA